MARSSSSSSLARPFAGVLGALVLSLFALDVASCSGGETTRKGAKGESCTKADDCEAPLGCIQMVCADPNAPPDGGMGGAGGGGGAGATGSSASATSSGSTGGGMPFNACDTCLKTTCAPQLAACDDECVAIEACLETICAHLSSIGAAADEGQCQTKCQSDHSGSKSAHLAVVNCVIGATSCLPPCVPYSQDFDDCVAYQDKGQCKAAKAACTGSSQCQTYKDCVSTCTTIADCLKCDDTPQGLAGRQLLETYEHCISAECIAVSWIPPA